MMFNRSYEKQKISLLLFLKRLVLYLAGASFFAVCFACLHEPMAFGYGRYDDTETVRMICGTGLNLFWFYYILVIVRQDYLHILWEVDLPIHRDKNFFPRQKELVRYYTGLLIIPFVIVLIIFVSAFDMFSEDFATDDFGYPVGIARDTFLVIYYVPYVITGNLYISAGVSLLICVMIGFFRLILPLVIWAKPGSKFQNLVYYIKYRSRYAVFKLNKGSHDSPIEVVPLSEYRVYLNLKSFSKDLTRYYGCCVDRECFGSELKKIIIAPICLPENVKHKGKIKECCYISKNHKFAIVWKNIDFELYRVSPRGVRIEMMHECMEAAADMIYINLDSFDKIGAVEEMRRTADMAYPHPSRIKRGS